MKAPTITATRPTANGIELDLIVDPALVWFQGHFPDLALLPGVVQLDWALALAAEHLAVMVPSCRNFQVKYKAGIFPGDHLTLALRHDPAKGRLNFEYRRDGHLCSTGGLKVPS